MKIENKPKNQFQIFLGGSTYSGKTTYLNTYFGIEFSNETTSSLGFEKRLIKEINKNKYYLWDTSRWCETFYGIIIRQIKNKADGVILMFDLSYRKDFDDLPSLLNLITECDELKNLPVLLIGNKSDLDIKVDENEIKKFLDKNNFIE